MINIFEKINLQCSLVGTHYHHLVPLVERNDDFVPAPLEENGEILQSSLQSVANCLGLRLEELTSPTMGNKWVEKSVTRAKRGARSKIISLQTRMRALSAFFIVRNLPKTQTGGSRCSPSTLDSTAHSKGLSASMTTARPLHERSSPFGISSGTDVNQTELPLLRRGAPWHSAKSPRKPDHQFRRL